jgi:hypothetical protein
MLYITDQHPRSPGVWALCASGAVVDAFPGPLGHTLAARALRKHGDVVLAAADTSTLIPWESDAVAFIGIPTSDKRVLDDMSFREFPLDLLAQTATAYGHDGAFLVGRIDSASVEQNRVPARGIIDPAIPGAADVLRALENDMLTRVSIDYTAAKVVPEILEVDAEGFPVDYLEHHQGVQMGGATLVSLSAFEDARIRLSSAYSIMASATSEAETESGSRYPVRPPVEWFADPCLPVPTRIMATSDGRVFGHLALWDSCHTGYPDHCVTPPRGTTYEAFTLGTLRCATGCRIPIGKITLGGGHADKRLGIQAAREHYDEKGTAVADVAAGEDEFGIWLAGALRPGVTDEQVRELEASPLSGDWRSERRGGRLELIAACAVNVPGFQIRPYYEVEVAADGSIHALVASLGPEPKSLDPKTELTLRSRLRPLQSERAEALRNRVHTPT